MGAFDQRSVERRDDALIFHRPAQGTSRSDGTGAHAIVMRGCKRSKRMAVASSAKWSPAVATASENIQVVADHDFARVRASDFFQKGFFRIWDLP